MLHPEITVTGDLTQRGDKYEVQGNSIAQIRSTDIRENLDGRGTIPTEFKEMQETEDQEIAEPTPQAPDDPEPKPQSQRDPYEQALNAIQTKKAA